MWRTPHTEVWGFTFIIPHKREAQPLSVTSLDFRKPKKEWEPPQGPPRSRVSQFPQLEPPLKGWGSYLLFLSITACRFDIWQSFSPVFLFVRFPFLTLASTPRNPAVHTFLLLSLILYADDYRHFLRSRYTPPHFLFLRTYRICTRAGLKTTPFLFRTVLLQIR